MARNIADINRQDMVVANLELVSIFARRLGRQLPSKPPQDNGIRVGESISGIETSGSR